MVWDDILNQEIPLGWSIKSIVDKSVSTKIKTGVLPYNGKKNYLATSNIKNSKIIEGKWVSFDDRESRANMTPTENSVWFAKRKGSVKHLTLTDNCNWFKDKYILSTGFFGLKTDVNTISYLHCVVNSSFFEKQKDNLSTGATQIAINGKNLKNIKVIYPQRDILVRFSSIVNPLIQKKLDLIKENQELYSLKEYLLPLFINQQIVFRDS
jgi:type I restriction enzyme S subunit